MATIQAKPARWRALQVRWLSGAAIVALLAAPVALALFADDGGAANLLRCLGLLLSVLVLYRSIGAQAPQRGELDERQLAERAWAMQIGFVVTAVLLGLLGGFTLLHSVITSIALPPLSLRLLGELLTSLFWIHMIVPSAVLAWRAQPSDED